jgi:hypothetical protein
MGGNAFPDLKVPRLSPEEYKTVRDKCVTILENFYKEVVCPPEAPEKIDHGDVDILVSVPRRDINMDEIASSLTAIRRTRVGVTTSFAVPHPTQKATYAQVDAHVCREGCLRWELWMGGYGDLVQIIGVLSRGIGLTMTDKGLHVRIPEIEPTNRKAAMIYLTSDVESVMIFLGLDVEAYRNGFNSIEKIYAWCAAGRFFGRDTEKKSEYSANDRSRLRKRKMFTDFLTEWVPNHPETFKNETKTPRDQVLQEAITFFHVEGRYNEAMNAWKLEEEERTVLEEVRNVIPEDGERSRITLRGLKRWTVIQNGMPKLRDETDPAEPAQAAWLRELKGDRKDHFLKWVIANYAELGSRERRRARSKITIHGTEKNLGRD